MRLLAWDGRSHGGVLGYRFFVVVLRLLPLWVSYGMLHFVVLYYILLVGASRRASYRFFRYHLGHGRRRAALAMYHNFYVFSQVLVDRLGLLAGVDKGFRFTFDGRQHLEQLVASKQSALLVGAHLGAWDMASHKLGHIGAKLHVVMFDNEHTTLKQFFDQLPGGRPFHIIPIQQNLSHVFAIQAAIQQGDLLCMHGDRFLPGSTTSTLPFLGQPARFPMGLFRMAHRLHLPVYFVHAVKTSARAYALSASPPLVADSPEALLQAYVTQLEAMVRRYPEQWFNLYDFWA